MEAGNLHATIAHVSRVFVIVLKEKNRVELKLIKRDEERERQKEWNDK